MVRSRRSTRSSTLSPQGKIFRNKGCDMSRPNREVVRRFVRHVSRIQHHSAYFNVIQQRDLVAVEGTTHSTTATGVDWRAGVSHSGRLCDLFEIRNFKIQRCYTSIRNTRAKIRSGIRARAFCRFAIGRLCCPTSCSRRKRDRHRVRLTLERLRLFQSTRVFSL